MKHGQNMNEHVHERRTVEMSFENNVREHMNLGFSFMNGLSVREQIIFLISFVHVPFIVRSSELC